MRSKRVLKAGIGYIAGGIFIKGIAFVTTPIFTRLLTTSEFGVLNSYLSYEAIIAMLVGFQFAASLKSANVEFSSNNKSALIEYTRVLIILVAIHSVIVLLLGNLFAGTILNLTGIQNRLLLNLLVINALGNAILTIYNAYVSISYSVRKYIIVAFVNAVLNIVISLVLILTIMRNKADFGRILGYVIPYVLVSIYIVFELFKHSGCQLVTNKKYIEFSYKYCSPLIPNGFAEVMLGQFGKLTVDNNLGKSSMGIYSLSYNVYSIIGIIRIAMDYVVGPFFFDKRKVNESKELKEFVRGYSRVLALTSIVIMLMTPEIVRVLGSMDYFDARFTAIPLVCASYYVFLVSVLSQEEYYSQKTYYVSLSSVIVMIINIIANFVIVPIVGELGAALITMFSYLLMIIIHYFIISKILKSDVFDFKAVFVDCLSMLFMSFISYLIVDLIIVRFCILVVIVVVAVISFNRFLKLMGRI